MTGTIIILSGFPEPSGNRMAIWLPGNEHMVFYLQTNAVAPPGVWIDAAEEVNKRLVEVVGPIEVPDEFVEQLTTFKKMGNELSQPDNPIKQFLADAKKPLANNRNFIDL